MPDIHDDVAGYVLGVLEPSESAEFEAHLITCERCRAEVSELGSLPQLMSDLPDMAELPPDLEEKTFAAIEAAAAEDAPNVVSLDKARSRRSRAIDRVLGAAAAIVFVALGFGIVSGLQSNKSAGPTTKVQLASAVGTDAQGTATIHQVDAGLDIDLTVSDMPASAPGTFYTCWLVGPGDTSTHQNRVSIGSFTVDKSGKATVHWTTAANLKQYPALGVTVEPDNGNPAHQGPKILQQV